MARILFIADIVGKIGRNAVKQELPRLKKKYKPDLVIANAENLAHGIGATQKTIDEMKAIGIDVFTSGNHIWEKAGSDAMLNDEHNKLLRPANYPGKKSGQGQLAINIGENKLIVVNLIGRVFFGWGEGEREVVHDPFKTLEKIISDNRQAMYLVDFHAEATSEKIALANYFDGRVSAVLGTHTHVQTADEKILPKGTAYISDAGMVGYADSIIGADKQQIYNLFLKTGQTSKKHDVPSRGAAVLNGIYIELDEKTRQAKKIERINKTIEVT
ncbi:MAG: TIGR00282 family metallophosphoesterase [Candidatus Buchananbacteria bacterium]